MMNDTEFRAVLDWRMCSDPWPVDSVPIEVIDDWIARESRERGYANWAQAYHEHQPQRASYAEHGQFGVGA